MVRRIWKITVTLDFIFRLVHYSSEDVSFNSICLNVLEGIKQFNLLMWVKKTRLETPFKGDNVKALVKRQIVKTWSLFLWKSSENCCICCAFLVFSDQTIVWKTKQSFENGFGFPKWSEILTLPASLKIKRHFSTAVAFGNSVFFKWKILSDDRRLYLYDSKWNSRSDVDGLHTKQLLNLLCIVYIPQPWLTTLSHPRSKLRWFVAWSVLEVIKLNWIGSYTHDRHLVKSYQWG